MPSGDTAQILASVVDLRTAIAQTREPVIRAELRRIETDLRRLLGPGVPKKQAARLLGVSVPALDRWIDRGRLPVVARPDSSRLAVDTRSLLQLAGQVERLRRRGVVRGLLSEAFKALGLDDDPAGRQVLREDIAALPRPNVPARELREQFVHTTPEERVLELFELNRSMNTLVGSRA
jgi:hypothetical protein